MSHSHSPLSEHDVPHYIAPVPDHPHIPIFLSTVSRWQPNTTQSTKSRTVQSLTGYEPNAMVEISSTEVTPVHHASEGQVFAQHNSGEDATCAPVYSQVDERQCIGRLAFTAAHAEERSKCNPCENLITLQEKIPCHAHHTFQAWANLLRCTPHKRKSCRDIRSVQEKHLTNEVVRVEQEEVRYFLTISQEKTQSKEDMKPYRDSETEFHTGVPLEQHRNQRLSEENFKDHSAGVEGATCSICHSKFGQTTSFSTYWNLPQRSGIMKVHEENKPCSMQNFKATRKLIEMLVLKTSSRSGGIDRNLLF